MAKGNMLQGQATGKVGDIVFMVRNGQQVARVYTSAGGRSGDQASIAVRRQRVRFGAASNQYLLYRNIVRGMYRTGKSTKQSDYNFFVRENVDLLPYLTKEENAAGVKCAMPGTFSRGTLGNLLYSILIEEDEGEFSYNVSVAGMNATTDILWDDDVSDLKTYLKSIFPNARKVTYAVCHILRTEVDLPSGSSYSHTFERGDVVFDLFEADPTVPDTSKIWEYFQAKAPSFYRSYFTSDLEGKVVVSGSSIFSIPSNGQIDDSVMAQTLVMMFATNDQVGDCYTSSLSAFNVPEDDGYLSLYASLRTDDHRQVAEDSYGYATGVMRTNIQQA